jgi:hypothetical protein
VEHYSYKSRDGKSPRKHLQGGNDVPVDKRTAHEQVSEKHSFMMRTSNNSISVPRLALQSLRWERLLAGSEGARGREYSGRVGRWGC